MTKINSPSIQKIRAKPLPRSVFLKLCLKRTIQQKELSTLQIQDNVSNSHLPHIVITEKMKVQDWKKTKAKAETLNQFVFLDPIQSNPISIWREHWKVVTIVTFVYNCSNCCCLCFGSGMCFRSEWGWKFELNSGHQKSSCRFSIPAKLALKDTWWQMSLLVKINFPRKLKMRFAALCRTRQILPTSESHSISAEWIFNVRCDDLKFVA